MSIFFSVTLVLLTASLSLIFSSLTYSLREFSRPKLTDRLTALGRDMWIEPTLQRSGELVFVTAIGRLFANLFVFISMVHMLRTLGVSSEWARFGLGVLGTSILTLFVSVAIPHSIAENVGETFIAYSIRFLHGWRFLMLPLTHIMHAVDKLVRNLAGQPASSEQTAVEQRSEELEQEILSAVEEGAEEGVVDEQEREMIQSVIHFGDLTCGEAMTARAKVIGVPIGCDLEQVKSLFEESGHSRLPVYDGTLDRVVGILYARDLLKMIGIASGVGAFDARQAMRPAMYVPDSKLLKDLLHDFRAQKTHIAIVIDEHGGTAGLVTIEDVLQELVGELSDENEPAEPSMLRRIDDHTSEVDGKMLVEQLNRVLTLNVPEEEGYETIGGFVSTTMGRIPEVGCSFEHGGARYTVTSAEPQRVTRVKVEKMVAEESPAPTTTA